MKRLLFSSLVLLTSLYANETKLNNSIQMIEKATELENEAIKTGLSKEFGEKLHKKELKNKMAKIIEDKELRNKHKELSKKIFEEKKNITYEDGKIVFKKREHETPDYQINPNASKPDVIEDIKSNNKIYIFMSSSIPKNTWINYAKALANNKLDNAALYIRGCIGGCEKIKPTIKFFREIIESDKKKPLETSIQIDPMLFKRYKITRVPCVVFTENIKFKKKDISQGLDQNIEDPGIVYKSCGDWSLSYHMRVIAKSSKNKEAEILYEKLEKAGY